MIYEILSVTDEAFIVRWIVSGKEITYPIPRDAQGRAFDAGDLDDWLFDRFAIDVAPHIDARNDNAGLEGEIGAQRTAKRKTQGAQP